MGDSRIPADEQDVELCQPQRLVEANPHSLLDKLQMNVGHPANAHKRHHRSRIRRNPSSISVSTGFRSSPMRSVKKLLSTVTTWETFATESRGRPESFE